VVLNLGHFGGGLHSQSLDWYWQTKHHRKIHKRNTTQQTNNTKHSKTKLPWFRCFLQHLARNQGGLAYSKMPRATMIWLITSPGIKTF